MSHYDHLMEEIVRTFVKTSTVAQDRTVETRPPNCDCEGPDLAKPKECGYVLMSHIPVNRRLSKI